MTQSSVSSRHGQRACIIVPTYNERDNIVVLLDSIGEARSRLDPRCELSVLVVDDSSPDGTADAVRAHPSFGTRTQLLVRTSKDGLGAAYKAGMRYAIETLRADILFEMDADLSHDPAEVPEMLARIADGADFVIGSRYVRGGTLPEHWGWNRRVISWLANTGARSVLGLRRVHDCSGGYRAIRRDVIASVGLDSIEATGYGFQISLLYRARQAGFRIVEVPIAFANRTEGSSKMRLRDWYEMAYLVFSLRFTAGPKRERRSEPVPETHA